jgi:hypothetical protein
VITEPAAATTPFGELASSIGRILGETSCLRFSENSAKLDAAKSRCVSVDGEHGVIRWQSIGKPALNAITRA